MTKSSPARLSRRGIARKAPAKGIKKRYQLTPEELTELRSLNQVATHERFLAEQIKANTALVPGGQQYSLQRDATARLAENYRNNWMAQKFSDCGFAPGVNISVDLRTGKLTENKAPKA